MYALVLQLIVKWYKIYACNKKCKFKALHHQEQQTCLQCCASDYMHTTCVTQRMYWLLIVVHTHTLCCVSMHLSSVNWCA